MIAELCACGDVATVTLTTPEGRVRACERCAGLLEMLCRLSGVKDMRRRPLLGLIRGSSSG